MPELNSQYISARQVETAYNKPVYDIINKSGGKPIAKIGWYPRWKRYVLYPYENTVWDMSCLANLVQFISELAEKKG